MIGERIKEIRVSAGLNQIDFGKRLSLSQSAVANYEKNVRVPLDAVIASICKEFNVSEEWLRTGDGDPYTKKSRSDEIRDYVDRIQGVNDTFKAQFAAALAALEEEDWKIILDVVNDIKNRSMAEKKRAVSAPIPTVTTDLTPEEQEVIRQLREKKRLAAESEDSSSGKRDMA